LIFYDRGEIMKQSIICVIGLAVVSSFLLGCGGESEPPVGHFVDTADQAEMIIEEEEALHWRDLSDEMEPRLIPKEIEDIETVEKLMEK